MVVLKKIIPLIFLIISIFLISQKVNAIQYISDCANLTIPEETYLLTQDIITNSSPCINVQASNIIFDCQNHRIESGGEIAIKIPDKTLITVKNCYLKNWYYGIYSSHSNNILVDNISLENVTVGLYFYNINESSIKNVRGYNLSTSINFVMGTKNSLENITFKKAYYGFTSYRSSYLTIKNVYLEDVCEGISIRGSLSYYSTNFLIENAYINEVYRGIEFEYTNNFTVKNTYIVKPKYLTHCGEQYYISGIYTYTETKNGIFKNITVESSSQYGFYIYGANYNLTFDGVISKYNYYGMYTEYGVNLTINNSKIIYNVNYGLNLYRHASFYIYNNLFNQTTNLLFTPHSYPQFYYFNTTKKLATNIVGGKWIGGNYWGTPSGAGYSDTCPDVNEDEFCDEPYTIYSNTIIVKDYLPYSTKAVAPPPPPQPPPPPPPIPPGVCRPCDYSRLNPRSLVEYFWIGVCLLLNLILCNAIFFALFMILLIFLYLFKEIRKKY